MVYLKEFDNTDSPSLSIISNRRKRTYYPEETIEAAYYYASTNYRGCTTKSRGGHDQPAYEN